MDNTGKDVIFSKIISIIFGIALGVLLYSAEKPPVLYKGPNSKYIVNEVFEYNGKKYKLKPKVCLCPSKVIYQVE